MSLEFSSTIDIHDSEILKLERGPVAYAKSKMGQSVNIDQFTKDLEEQCNQAGFLVTVKVFDTNESGVYAFEVEINGRTGGSVFDPDRQVHEVVGNLLALPGEGGWINTQEALREAKRTERTHGKKHGH